MIQYLHLSSPWHTVSLHRYSSHRAEPLWLPINIERFATILAGKRYSKETPVPFPLAIKLVRQWIPGNGISPAVSNSRGESVFLEEMPHNF